MRTIEDKPLFYKGLVVSRCWHWVNMLTQLLTRSLLFALVFKHKKPPASDELTGGCNYTDKVEGMIKTSTMKII